MKNPGIIMHKASKTQIIPRFFPQPMPCFSTGSPPPSTTLLCTGIFSGPFPVVCGILSIPFCWDCN